MFALSRLISASTMVTILARSARVWHLGLCGPDHNKFKKRKNNALKPQTWIAPTSLSSCFLSDPWFPQNPKHHNPQSLKAHEARMSLSLYHAMTWKPWNTQTLIQKSLKPWSPPKPDRWYIHPVNYLQSKGTQDWTHTGFAAFHRSGQSWQGVKHNHIVHTYIIIIWI